MCIYIETLNVDEFFPIRDRLKFCIFNTFVTKISLRSLFSKLHIKLCTFHKLRQNSVYHRMVYDNYRKHKPAGKKRNDTKDLILERIRLQERRIATKLPRRPWPAPVLSFEASLHPSLQQQSPIRGGRQIIRCHSAGGLRWRVGFRGIFVQVCQEYFCLVEDATSLHEQHSAIDVSEVNIAV